MLRQLALLAALAAPLTSALAQAENSAPSQGFLCCNMRTDGKWISDINYAESGTRLIPAGTPVKVTGFGRHRVLVEIEGSKQAIGNDYSRTMDLNTFASRYVTAQDPKAKLNGYPKKVREAIEAGRLQPGMTREQVLMSVGYPVSSENPQLDAKVWRFWRSSFAEFQVVFGDDGRVKEVVADPATRNLVVAE
ncbi:hypothetical protein [Caldimonas brevitalea]|uniref:Lipoprotein SmpA/OmlA domain-containing protein n=1 Tax=Caldimonas brevitalea TaxID=413882 RepID=A0A0G3BHT5_9BURK|nr:hypothetical protein [Caldimonas brevitalea]AKJ27548.1 hypothetical protein AAW51_0857 [Caldimonas brevitalea]